MKKLSIVVFVVIALFSGNLKGQNQLKRYDVKSGILEYETTISGNMMGGTVTGSGTEKLFFRDYGALELKEEVSEQTTAMKMFGQESTETTNTHTINKLDNGKSYNVDFNNKVIYVSTDPMMAYMSETGTDAGEAGKDMMEAMGGTKVGDESYKGYDCEIWELLGGRQWIYKGVMLKLEINIMGINTVTEATSIKFDISVADANFKLPDFPVQ